MLHSGCGPEKQKLPSPTTDTTGTSGRVSLLPHGGGAPEKQNLPPPPTDTPGTSGRASLTPNAAAMPQPKTFGPVPKYCLSSPPNAISGSMVLPESTSAT